jgi:hypothetical protein
VGPVIGALSAATTGDPQWLRRLLDLAAGPGPHPWHSQDLSVSKRYHHPAPGEVTPTERGLAPPAALLSWLVERFTVTKDSKFGTGTVAENRRALGRREPGMIAKAHEALARSRPARGWYVLEGYTSPDVYLVTPEALIVVEGKRTEAGSTTSTTWMAGRHQMLRHIDAAWEIRGKRSVYGLFIVEALTGTVAAPAVWEKAAEATRGDGAIRSSLPHRTGAEQDAIRQAFIGVTTWQAVMSEFGLNPDLLD